MVVTRLVTLSDYCGLKEYSGDDTLTDVIEDTG